MPKRGDGANQQFRWWISDRSGLQYGFQPVTSEPNAYSRESGKPVDDRGLKVAPTEYDTPPPSKKSLGGEGDISGDPRPNSDPATPSNAYVVPPGSQSVVVYVNSSTPIAWNNQPAVFVAGSNATQTMAVNPQIVAGYQGLQIALECVGSSITLRHGSGISIDFNSSQVVMTSGAIAVLFFQSGDLAWHMTSFNPSGGL